MPKFNKLKRVLKSYREKRPESWENKDAAEYAETLLEEFGPPDAVNPRELLWKDKAQFDRFYIKDESIDHDFPEPHKDFVYSVNRIAVPEDKAKIFPEVSGSIIIDRLKKEVTARCGTLFANAVTLGFVEDVVAGNVAPENAKEEYARRIKEGVLPDWYKNELGE